MLLVSFQNLILRETLCSKASAHTVVLVLLCLVGDTVLLLLLMIAMCYTAVIAANTRQIRKLFTVTEDSEMCFMVTCKTFYVCVSWLMQDFCMKALWLHQTGVMGVNATQRRLQNPNQHTPATWKTGMSNVVLGLALICNDYCRRVTLIFDVVLCIFTLKS